MQRIVILGAVGAGKSTLARKLGEKFRLPVIHLDPLFYKPGWAPSERSLFQQRVSEAIKGERWITDGNFMAETAASRVTRADTIIWIEQPIWLRFARAVGRTLVGGRRDDLAAGCRDRLDWALLNDILSFNRVERAAIEAALAKWAPNKPILRLKGDRAVTAFLRSI